MKAITAERDSLSVFKNILALAHAELESKHKDLLRSHGDLQAQYKAHEEEVVGLRCAAE